MAKIAPVYLDYAAATPMDRRVELSMKPYLSQKFYNPSAIYQSARQVKQVIHNARKQVANALAVAPNEVVFTAGATESINMAIGGVMGASKGNIVVGAGEHSAVVAAAKMYAQAVKVCPLDASGVIDTKKLQTLIDKKTIMVSIQYANNELGTIQPIAKIARLINSKTSKTHKKIYFHTDASQAPSYLSLNVRRLGVDLLTLNGSKIYGPKHTGCLYVRSGTDIKPIIAGGGQERGLRGGTENVAGIVGFAKALSLCVHLREQEVQRLGHLQAHLLKKLLTRLDGVRLNGAQKPRLPGNVNLSIEGVNGETLLHYLDQAGFMVATGAACNASDNMPSATLMAIGLDRKQSDSSLRITMGRPTTKAQLDRFITALIKNVALLRQQA